MINFLWLNGKWQCTPCMHGEYAPDFAIYYAYFFVCVVHYKQRNKLSPVQVQEILFLTVQFRIRFKTFKNLGSGSIRV